MEGMLVKMVKENVKKKIGERIEFIKEQKGMTNQEFAEYIKTTTQQLSYVIRGERGFSIAKLIDISEITGYPIEFILTGKKSNIDHEVREKIEQVNIKMQEISELLNDISALIK